jgi:hypothetical protein
MMGISLADKPALNEVRDWIAELDGAWADLLNEMSLEEQLYYQDFPLEAPYGRGGMKTGSAPADADAAVDSIMPSKLQVRARPRRATREAKKQAEKLAHFGRAWLDYQQRDRDVVREVVSDAVIRRYGVFRVMTDDSHWEPLPPGWRDMDEEDQDLWQMLHRARFPITLERRDPKTVRWYERNGELLIVVEQYETLVADAWDLWRDLDAARDILAGRQPYERVMVHDVWYGPYRCLLLQNEPIYPGGDSKYRGILPHGYGEIPYVTFPFREVPSDKPAERYRGLYSAAGAMYPIESQVLTMNYHMLRQNAWRTWTYFTVDGRDIQVVPGMAIPIDRRAGRDEYIEMLRGEPVPPELLQFNNVVDAYIQRNGVAQGPRAAEGTRSAQQLWAIQAQRQQKIEDARQGLKRALQKCLRLMAMQIEQNLDERVTLPISGRDEDGDPLGEVSIGPRDIAGYYDAFDVRIGRTSDPAALEAAKTWQAMAQNNFVSLETAWERSDLDIDAEEEMDRLIDQAINRDPTMMELATLRRIRNEFGEDSIEYWIYLKKLVEERKGGQGAAQPGAPGVPSGGHMQPPGAPRPGPGAAGQQALANTMMRPSRPTGRGGGARQYHRVAA